MSEKILVVGLPEIEELEIRCGECGGRSVLKMKPPIDTEIHCASCNTKWPAEGKAVNALQEAFETCGKLKGGCALRIKAEG
jgi:DNA-directed RNA polymerase subunit RPC12/RpoP